LLKTKPSTSSHLINIPSFAFFKELPTVLKYGFKSAYFSPNGSSSAISSSISSSSESDVSTSS
jgi:hypothetical protein